MASDRRSLVVTIKPEELQFILLSVRYMNFTFPEMCERVCPEEDRSSIEKYLEARAKIIAVQ